ncbi:MAG: GntR family transcriptional regulator [Desulfobacula sp.]|nr:GntR family transcriptional regulator [Desulfobacula sp.]
MAASLEELAYNKIKVAIFKGYIKKGNKLKEVSLSKSLNMSRATVKGAVKRLVYEGLAEHKPNKGVSVVNPSFEEIKESFQVRSQLEKMAISLAIENFNPNDFVELQKLIEIEKIGFPAEEQDKEYNINAEFHMKIAQRSENSVLVHYINELIQKSTIYLILFDPFYQRLDMNNTSPVEHQEILHLLEKKDGERAGTAMGYHLESTLNNIDVNQLLPNDYLIVQ